MAKNIADILAHEPADELIFEGPFDRTIRRSLVIRSLIDKDMAFKMKTTSPRLFFVRPKIGILPAESSLTIEMYMLPTPFLTPNPLEKSHKFLIVAAEASKDVEDLKEFFKGLDPANTWEGKVDCKLVPPKPETNEELLTQNLEESICHTDGGISPEETERSTDASEGN